MAQLTIFLTKEAKEKLIEWSERECRDPRRQAGLIILRELERQKLLPSHPLTPTMETAKDEQK